MMQTWHACVDAVGLKVKAGVHAGDSRAVLCRGNVAIPLTDDHKAAREDEVVRLLTSL